MQSRRIEHSHVVPTSTELASMKLPICMTRNRLGHGFRFPGQCLQICRAVAIALFAFNSFPAFSENLTPSPTDRPASFQIPTILSQTSQTDVRGGSGARVIAQNHNFIANAEAGSDAVFDVLHVFDHPTGLSAIAWSADSRTIASATIRHSGPGFLNVWDVETGNSISRSILERTNVVNAEVPIGLLGNLGMIIVPASVDRRIVTAAVRLRPYRDGRSDMILAWPDDVADTLPISYRRIVTSPDERTILVAAGTTRGGEIVAFRMPEHRSISRIAYDQHVLINDVRFNHSGTLVAHAVGMGANASSYRVLVTNSSLEPARTLVSESDSRIISIAFSGNDQYLATGAGGSWGRQSTWASRLLDVKGRGQQVLARDINASVPPLRIWEVDSGREVARIDAPDAGISAVDWSRDDRFIAGVLYDHSIMVWSWPSRERVFMVRPAPHAALSLCAQFSPNGRMLALCAGTSLIVLGRN